MTDASAIVTAALASLAPYAGPGTLVATVVGGIVAVSRTLASTRLKRAETRLKVAEAKSIEAQTDSAQVQRGLVDAETIATALGQLAEMRDEQTKLTAAQVTLAGRLDECERKHGASEREVGKLRREMERRGWTPPGGFPAPEESEA